MTGFNLSIQFTLEVRHDPELAEKGTSTRPDGDPGTDGGNFWLRLIQVDEDGAFLIIEFRDGNRKRYPTRAAATIRIEQ